MKLKNDYIVPNFGECLYLSLYYHYDFFFCLAQQTHEAHHYTPEQCSTVGVAVVSLSSRISSHLQVVLSSLSSHFGCFISTVAPPKTIEVHRREGGDKTSQVRERISSRQDVTSR